MHWKIRFTLKVLAGKAPALKRLFKAMGYYRHGNMESVSYARGVFDRHFGAAIKASSIGDTSRMGGVCLELGPGDSLFTAMLARAAGFDRTLLVDAGSQIAKRMDIYVTLSRILRSEGQNVPEVQPDWTAADLLNAYSADYLTDGLTSLANLDPGSIDFLFSHAVLEHIPKADVAETLRQLKRISKPGSVSSHVVDLRDHLGGAVNHLRFVESQWESDAIRQSGVYTNRFRISQWKRLFADAGLECRMIEESRYATHSVAPSQLTPEFAQLDAEDLLTHGFHALLTSEPA